MISTDSPVLAEFPGFFSAEEVLQLPWSLPATQDCLKCSRSAVLEQAQALADVGLAAGFRQEESPCLMNHGMGRGRVYGRTDAQRAFEGIRHTVMSARLSSTGVFSASIKRKINVN